MLGVVVVVLVGVGMRYELAVDLQVTLQVRCRSVTASIQCATQLQLYDKPLLQSVAPGYFQSTPWCDSQSKLSNQVTSFSPSLCGEESHTA